MRIASRTFVGTVKFYAANSGACFGVERGTHSAARPIPVATSLTGAIAIDIGYAVARFPCHTTVRTGPYTAVRFDEHQHDAKERSPRELK